MKKKPFKAVFLDKVKKHINSLSLSDQAIVAAHVQSLAEGRYDLIYTKTLKSPICELVVRQFRLLYFVIEETIYMVSIFRKKTQKTPKREIQQAEKIYKMFKQKN